MANTADWKRALKNSDYWAWFTEWLLSFGGKAAWPILIICTLYMGAELYPGVNLPAGLNFAVFLAQLFALDMGGMGLVSIARQVKDAGHEEAAKEADRFGKVLVAIVITSLVTVGIKQFLSNIPSLTTPVIKGGHDSIMATYIDPAITVVEFILVIARVVCAVLYGKVMHTLKISDYTSPPALSSTIDEWAIVGMAASLQQEMHLVLSGIQASFTTQLEELASNQNLTIADLQTVLAGVQNTVPTIDIQEIAGAVLTSLEPQIASEIKMFQADLRRQMASSPSLDDVMNRLDKVEVMFRQSNDTPIPSAQQPSKKVSPDVSKLNHTGMEKIRPLHPVEDRETLVVRMWNEDRTRSTQTIAALTGVPKSTVAYYLKPYRDQLDTNETPSSETTA
ncbi:MAG TPA: hypothetical protein VFV38_13495 [Ktedonobacteraceae bacterium]|nr:hypothetical protein [Ktedonobacteraceae bacterium]